MKTTLLIALLVALASPAIAEGEDPAFTRNLFAPDLVPKHAREIDLSKPQRSALTKDIGQVTDATTELQLSMIDGFGAVEELSAAR